MDVFHSQITRDAISVYKVDFKSSEPLSARRARHLKNVYRGLKSLPSTPVVNGGLDGKL